MSASFFFGDAWRKFSSLMRSISLRYTLSFQQRRGIMSGQRRCSPRRGKRLLTFARRLSSPPGEVDRERLPLAATSCGRTVGRHFLRSAAEEATGVRERPCLLSLGGCLTGLSMELVLEDEEEPIISSSSKEVFLLPTVRVIPLVGGYTRIDVILAMEPSFSACQERRSAGGKVQLSSGTFFDGPRARMFEDG